MVIFTLTNFEPFQEVPTFLSPSILHCSFSAFLPETKRFRALSLFMVDAEGFFNDPDVLAGDMISKTNETKIKPKKNEMNKLANVCSRMTPLIFSGLLDLLH